MKYIIILITTILFLNKLNAQFTCGDSLLDIRDGQKYLTVQIGEQCWMAENLNIGSMISSTTGGQLQTDNDTIEKYCYNNDSANCDIYGALYEWNELMQYNPSDTNMIGITHGICPNGWHIPTHHEWTSLEREICTSGYCDSDFPYDFTTWDWRGTNEGSKLAGNIAFWNMDLLTSNIEFGTSDFSGLPAGYRHFGVGSFTSLGNISAWWAATIHTDSLYAWYRVLADNNTKIRRFNYHVFLGLSVRCVRDIDTVTSLTIPQPDGSISVYPSPNDGIFYVLIENKEQDKFNIEIINANGQVIVRKEYYTTTTINDKVDISNYPQGVYIIRIVSDRMTKTEKIILE